MSTSTHDIEGSEYAKSVVVRAPRETVFRAISSLDGLRSWWTPLVSGSADVGGDIRFAFDGMDEYIVMHVDSANSPSSVRWTCVAHTGHPEWIGTQPVFELADMGIAECSLEFRHIGLEPVLDCYDQCERGWDHFLGSIAGYAESGVGAPFGT